MSNIVDDKHLTACIYHNGCGTTVRRSLSSLSLPDYILPNGKLGVANDNVCEKINLKYWSIIEANDDLCNTIEEDVAISDYPYLNTLAIGKNSFMNTTQLILRNLPNLNSFSVGEMSFENAHRVIVDSNFL